VDSHRLYGGAAERSPVAVVEDHPLYSASAEMVYDRTRLSTTLFGYDVFGYDYDRTRTIETAIAA